MCVCVCVCEWIILFMCVRWIFVRIKPYIYVITCLYIESQANLYTYSHKMADKTILRHKIYLSIYLCGSLRSLVANTLAFVIVVSEFKLVTLFTFT